MNGLGMRELKFIGLGHDGFIHLVFDVDVEKSGASRKAPATSSVSIEMVVHDKSQIEQLA